MIESADSLLTLKRSSMQACIDVLQGEAQLHDQAIEVLGCWNFDVVT